MVYRRRRYFRRRGGYRGRRRYAISRYNTFRYRSAKAQANQIYHINKKINTIQKMQKPEIKTWLQTYNFNVGDYCNYAFGSLTKGQGICVRWAYMSYAKTSTHGMCYTSIQVWSDRVHAQLHRYSTCSCVSIQRTYDKHHIDTVRDIQHHWLRGIILTLQSGAKTSMDERNIRSTRWGRG